MAKMKIIAAREKFLSRPISELDLSACERCGPSYRLLPKNFPKAAASARTELCNQARRIYAEGFFTQVLLPAHVVTPRLVCRCSMTTG